jgi:hypothetical protein
VIDRVVSVFGCGAWFAGLRRAARPPDALEAGTGSDRAGAELLSGSQDGVAGQAGSARMHSRCQQVRKASFPGQVRLIFSTRARAWQTSGTTVPVC